ncbi:MAG: methionyl-tRNA formyltransferase [Thermodesulfobacteriota bacterium]|nr:methionyl-tRNA formyltransferase [Thermodesulfobacteriota bacterium]
MKPKIIFMGTPEFAIPSLEILVKNNCPIIGVVTQPDRPKGRGKKHVAPPVKTAARKYNLPVIQPEKVRDEEFLDIFRKLSPDMVVLVAFGQILPGEIIEFPEMGCINVHPSLLPKYRGAAPINWTLIRGEETTGITTILMDEGMDTGDILLQEETTIESDETFDKLHDRLSTMGSELLLKTVEGITEGTITRTPQDSTLATYAPRLKKEDSIINWQAGIKDILNLIKGLYPSPCAHTFIKEKKLKIFAATGEESNVPEAAGRIVDKTKKGLQVAAKNGYIYLEEIQLENKRRMSVHDFLRGYRISQDDILG